MYISIDLYIHIYYIIVYNIYIYIYIYCIYISHVEKVRITIMHHHTSSGHWKGKANQAKRDEGSAVVASLDPKECSKAGEYPINIYIYIILVISLLTLNHH